MEDWFTIDKIDKEKYIISEYRHWEESHSYLLNGSVEIVSDCVMKICSYQRK